MSTRGWEGDPSAAVGSSSSTGSSGGDDWTSEPSPTFRTRIATTFLPLAPSDALERYLSIGDSVGRAQIQSWSFRSPQGLGLSAQGPPGGSLTQPGKARSGG